MSDIFADIGYRPAARFDEAGRLSETLTRRILPVVAKPARYIGLQLSPKAAPAEADGWNDADAKILLSFPDACEIAMSHTGLRILYDRLRGQAGTTVDLAFAPWPDMEEAMRGERLPLFSLAGRRPARHFDLWGFSLGYELAYSNVLTMIDLAGVPLPATARGEGDPIVVAGGACTSNPAVIAPFFDLLVPGDGEEVILELADVVREGKAAGESRAEICDRLAGIDGVWRPGSGPVHSRVLADLNAVEAPEPLVPVFESVHDRLTLEIMRGCARGCRFCQAGMLDRPVRERNVQSLVDAAAGGTRSSGWGEISLLSLSSSDYSKLDDLVKSIRRRLDGRHTDLVLPSLRIDALDEHLAGQVGRGSSGTFTFAPEAGSQRLRDVINKQITEEEILRGAKSAFATGAKSLKLYFMIGLPTETDEDLEELVSLVGKLVGLAPRGGGQIVVSISPFAPKPHTPFQWSGQITRREIARRNSLLEKKLRRWKVRLSLRDPEVSRLEAVIGLGDGRLAEVVARAWIAGARFDGWTECFDAAIWDEALAAAGVDPRQYLDARDPAAELPWDEIRTPVDREFLVDDWRRALRGETLSDCRLGGECYDCAACAAPLTHIAARGADAADAVDDPAAQPDPAFDPRNADPADQSREARKWEIWRGQTAAKCWHRVEYAREGDCALLGHLDFQRQLQLALRRSGLPVAYSRGYHPRPLLKFGPPLPVGVAGAREVFDMALIHGAPEWCARLDRALPQGLRIRRSRIVGAITPRSIDSFAVRHDYEAELPLPAEGGPTAIQVAEICDRFLASASWPILRRRPKGDVEVDARRLLGGDDLTWHEAGRDTDDGLIVLRFSLVREQDASSLPVHDFLAALLGESLTETRCCRVTRLGYFGRDVAGRWLSPFEEVGEENRRIWMRRRLRD